MGFRVRRSAFVTPQIGIVSFINAANITIRNGSVVDWGLSGINLNGKGNLIENVHTSGNGTSGILIGSVGSQSIVRNCSAADNASDGIDIGYYGMALDCVSNSNGRNGVSGSISAVVARCAVTAKSKNGINILDEGFSTSEGALVIDSLARSNSNHDILVKGGVTVRGNQFLQNSLDNQAGSGIRVTGSYCMVSDNNCIRNGTGVLVTGITNFIARNACSSNSRNWSVAADLDQNGHFNFFDVSNYLTRYNAGCP